MHDVFRAVTLSFLIAALYLLLSVVIDYVAIYALQSGNLRYTTEENLRLALATASLVASLLCVWVLLVTAFAKKYVTHLRANTTLLVALLVALPIVLLQRLLPLLDDKISWSPTVTLVFAVLWSSIGLHAVLWYITIGACIRE
ncbi:MAG: hypothetical protein PVF13_01580 [Chromatiales bacterium]|jgi:hypothetical protein